MSVLSVSLFLPFFLSINKNATRCFNVLYSQGIYLLDHQLDTSWNIMTTLEWSIIFFFFFQFMRDVRNVLYFLFLFVQKRLRLDILIRLI